MQQQLDSLVIFKFEDEFERFIDQNQIIKKQLFRIHSLISPGDQSIYDKFIHRLPTQQLNKLIKLVLFSQLPIDTFQQYLQNNHELVKENEYLIELNREQQFQLNFYRNIFYFADLQNLKQDIESRPDRYEIVTDFIYRIVDYKQLIQIESYMFYFMIGLLFDKNIINVLDELLLNDFNDLDIEMDKFQQEVIQFMTNHYQNNQNGLIELIHHMIDLIQFDLIELDPDNDIDVSRSIVHQTLQTKFRIMNFKSKQKQQKVEKQISLLDNQDDVYESKDNNYHQQLRFSLAANSMLMNSRQMRKKNNAFKSSAIQLEESCLMNLKQSQSGSFIQQDISFGEKDQSQEYSLNINSIGYNNQSIEFQQLQNSIQISRKSLIEKQNEYSRYICNKTAFLSNKYDKHSMGNAVVHSKQMGIDCHKYNYYEINHYKENNQRLKQFQLQTINWEQEQEQESMKQFTVQSINNQIQLQNRKWSHEIRETDYCYPKENDEDQLTKIIKKEMQRLEDKFGDQIETIIKQGLKSISKKVKQEFEFNPNQNYFTMMYQQLNTNKQSEFPIIELFEEGLLNIEEYTDYRYFLETFNCDIQQSAHEIRNKQYCQYQKVKMNE